MKQRAILAPIASAVLDDQRAGGERAEQIGFGERMAGNDARARGRRPKSLARWVLPEPSGPTNATARAGQSGQDSISASAPALPDPDRKSSRA